MDVWWKTNAVETRPGVPRDNASSQKLAELKTRVSRRTPDMTCLVSDTGGSGDPSGKSPTSSGRFLTINRLTGTINMMAKAPITA